MENKIYTEEYIKQSDQFNKHVSNFFISKGLGTQRGITLLCQILMNICANIELEPHELKIIFEVLLKEYSIQMKEKNVKE